VLKLPFRPTDGHHALDERALSLNLSFVLHERSDSVAVRSAVRAIRRHASIVARLDQPTSLPKDARDTGLPGVDCWLTATIGVPDRLAKTLDVTYDKIVNVDSPVGLAEPMEFFRARADLTLPSDIPEHVGVAALILRPDHQTSQLIVTGVHDWPADRRGALRSLERLIQAHAGQWMPPRALWPAPAESLLPDEVY
jgi:hypothetical protein